MPARSQAQRGLIFSKRDQYKSKAKTPKKWQWVWDEDFENKGKLPKKVTEGIGFEETRDGDQYIDSVIEMLQHASQMGFDEAESYFEKYYDLVADCYGEGMSSSECADQLLSKAENDLEETVQNVVFNESNTRAIMVNENWRNNPSDYWMEFEAFLSDILGDDTDAAKWMEDNFRRLELFHADGTHPEDAAGEVGAELLG
jgi:hypothetical protein